MSSVMQNKELPRLEKLEIQELTSVVHHACWVSLNWQNCQRLTVGTLSWCTLTVPALVTEIGQSLQDGSVQKVNGSSANTGRSM